MEVILAIVGIILALAIINNYQNSDKPKTVKDNRRRHSYHRVDKYGTVSYGEEPGPNCKYCGARRGTCVHPIYYPRKEHVIVDWYMRCSYCGHELRDNSPRPEGCLPYLPSEPKYDSPESFCSI